MKADLFRSFSSTREYRRILVDQDTVRFPRCEKPHRFAVHEPYLSQVKNNGVIRGFKTGRGCSVPVNVPTFFAHFKIKTTHRFVADL